MVPPVRRRDEFEALGRTRARGRSGPISVAHVARRDGDPEAVRVAYSIPRSVGGAVVRNRLRRRLRAMMAELVDLGGVAPGAYLVGGRAGAPSLSAAELRRHLRDALGSAAQRGGR